MKEARHREPINPSTGASLVPTMTAVAASHEHRRYQRNNDVQRNIAGEMTGRSQTMQSSENWGGGSHLTATVLESAVTAHFLRAYWY